MHTRVINKHFFDASSLEVDLVIEHLLSITNSYIALSELLLRQKFVLGGEDPQLVVLQRNLVVHRLRRRVAECDVFHCERAIQACCLRGKAVLILHDYFSGAMPSPLWLLHLLS